MLEERLNVKLANCDDEHSRKSAVECAATARRGERGRKPWNEEILRKTGTRKKMDFFLPQAEPSLH